MSFGIIFKKNPARPLRESEMLCGVLPCRPRLEKFLQKFALGNNPVSAL